MNNSKQLSNSRKVESEAAFVAPRNDIEKQLADMWADLLALECIGIHDNFFELGGQSLIATQVMARLQKAFGVELPLECIFQAPTIAGLATEVEKARSAGAVQRVPAIGRISRETNHFPTSFSQQRLWFLEQLTPGRSVYNMSRSLRLKGQLDIGALEQSLNEIVRRHEILRTTFASMEGEPVQIVSPTVAIQLPIENLRHIPEAKREAAAIKRLIEEIQRPFDLSCGPLLRTLLLQLDKDNYIFLITMHHIISDGWSMSVFQHEMTVLYEAYLNGRPSQLEELPIQYVDYSVWQREWLQGKVLEEQLAYWKKNLVNVSTLQLPTDRSRPAIQSDNSAWELIELGKPLTDSLIALSKREGVTLFMTLLAAFNTLLHRYTGQNDIIVGSPIANRSHVDIENMIGFFVNTLALRTDLSGDPSFSKLLQRVSDIARNAYEHQDLPFEKLVAELHPKRNMSQSPLFQVMFVLQNIPIEELEITNLTVSSFPISTGTAKFDLTLSLTEKPAGLCGVMEYNTDLFDQSTIIRMLGNFQTLLQGVIANPDCRISQLPLLTKWEVRQVLKEWNANQTDYPQKACVHKLFEAQAIKTPDSIAVIFEEQELTYRQLNEAANALAEQLQTLSVGPDIPVGIMMDRSLEMIMAVLGVLKAGGAYVPLDPTYPDERLLFILRDTQAKVLLTQRNLSDVSDSFENQVLYLDGRASQPAMKGKCNPGNNTSLQNAAYMIYTSGSTGTPKGIIMNHGALCNLINWQLKNTKINPKARTLQFASLGFDVSFQEMFSTWCAGGTLILIPESLRRDILGLLRFIDRMSLERIFVPFVVLQHLAEMAVSHKLIPRHLREIITAGEQLQITPSIRKMVRRLEHCTLHNQYGPSEAHVVTSYTLVGDPESWPQLPPIGRPIANARIYILDHNRNPQPIGVSGELYIGGQCLSSGYLNRPELNDEKFVKDPFNPLPGARLYRTGDLARYLPDGNIEFLGRIDTQVKLRGFRIELGEIESVLSVHESVREAVVLLREDKPGEKCLVGYVVSREDVSLSVEDLRTYLRQRLPDYMIPSYFVQLETLPLTPNGKIDRKALPIPDRSLLERGEPGSRKKRVAPRTDLEKEIADIWQDVLGVTHLGIHDNFFELGGNSIKGAMFINRLQQKLGVIVQIVALFNAPTVAKLAYYLTEHYASAFTTMTSAVVSRRSCSITKKIKDVELARLRERIPSLPPRSEKRTGKNPQAIFILSPPRSGSTLLRVVLGGHPHLFAPPELFLLSFNTLNERKMAFAGQRSFWGQGSIRALMQIHECDFKEAQQLMQDAEKRDLTTKEFYHSMQESLADRILVDKTTTYSLLPDVMVRAESDFENPLYIHLVRHPCGTILSFEDAEIDQLMYFLMPCLEGNGDVRFSCREFAELVWIISHQNIMNFLKGIPESRQHRITFEDLTSDPVNAVQAICRFLDLDYHPDMLQPYKEKKQRMTDGVHSVSRMLGDIKFHEHKGIETKTAYRWKTVYSEDSLADITRRMAKQLGYKRMLRSSSEHEVGWI